MTKEGIFTQYHAEVNEIYDNNSKAVAHLKRGNLSEKYMARLKVMLKGGTLTKSEYDWITDRMLVLGLEMV